MHCLERSMLEASSPTDGSGITRTGSQSRRSELHLHTDGSHNQSLSSPPSGVDYHAKHHLADVSSSGYDSNPLTDQVLYYGPEALDTTQEHLEAAIEKLDMGLCS